MARVELLSCLPKDYHDGRSKSFYCTASHLLTPDSLRVDLARAQAEMSDSAEVRDRAGLLRAAISRQANAPGIDLILRR